jgi:flagellar biosynthetic protein FliR
VLDSLPIAALAEPVLFAGFLIMLRMIGLLLALPALGSGTFGGPTRMTIIVFMTVYFYSALGAPFVPVPTEPATAVMMLTREFLIGSGLGVFMRLFFAIADASGAIIGMTMSLSMAGMVDPSTGEQSTSIANLFSLGTLLIFVSLGGHHEVIKGLWANFQAFPIAETTLVGFDLAGLEELGRGLFTAAIRISAPVIICTTLVNVGLGLMARAAPQVNIFAVGFSVLLCVGLALMDTTILALRETYEDRIPTLSQDMNQYLQVIDEMKLAPTQ